MAKMSVMQRDQMYYLYTPQGICVAQLFMGQDGQYMQDVKTVAIVGKAMARRWGIELDN